MNNKIALCAIAPPPPRLLISKKMDFRKKATSVEKNTLVNREGASAHNKQRFLGHCFGPVTEGSSGKGPEYKAHTQH